MAIDRIGGKGPPAPAPEAAGAGQANRAGGAFELGRAADATKAAGAEGVQQAGAPSALDRLRAGEIDARAYVELKVEEATRHLTQLRPADLEVVRSELRHRMLADPALADLVQTATGTRLSPSDE